MTLDVSKLSGWLNAVAPCRESNGEHAVRGEGAGQQTGGDGVQRAVEARLQIGGRTGVGRTQNIWYMFVTLEVSQLETSASKFCKFEKSPLMSVMDETSQSAMGPYVLIAALGAVS